ncbi:MAG: hypothetical protein H0W02_10195 [Ktedonobacteraceae bacterium]|nr:hypothetical protein [Ktedonobacteraceae bacterium]
MDTLGIHGIIRLYALPAEWTDEQFRSWWCPETDAAGNILRPARISDEAKQSRLIGAPVENIITNTGIALLLTNMAVAGQGMMNPFFQILSVGNGTATGVARTDISVQGDGFASGARKAPASYTVSGFTTTIVTNYASGDGVGAWTNIGIYGYNTSSVQAATTTTGTGALMTHALFSFTKGASAIAVDYALTLSN